MANNRLLIYCKECLGCMGIAKYYPVSWDTPWDANALKGWMNDFWEKHDACLQNSKVELGMDGNIFALTSDTEWDGYMDPYCGQLFKEKPEWWDTDDHKHG